MLNSREATEAEELTAGLKHRVYLPQAQGKVPLVLLVHGRAGDARVPWIFSKALETIKPAVVTPQAPEPDPLGGFSWWLMSHSPDSESPAAKTVTMEELQAPLARLSEFIEKTKELYPVDPERIYALGFSQGAAMLSTLSLRRPELFKGVALLSGFIPRSAMEAYQGRMLSGGPDYFISHGRQDAVVPFHVAEESKSYLEQHGADVTFHSDDVGHKVGTAGIRRFRQWIEERLGSTDSELLTPATPV